MVHWKGGKELSEPASGLPRWIVHRDGRKAPFDPDAISQALFAASEALDRPDAFLVRELTDGVLHFLQVECGPGPLSTDQLADLIVKVVRELGDPELAQAFMQRRVPTAEPTSAVVRAVDPQGIHFGQPLPARELVLEQWGLEAVYSRDLAAAHREGLLTLDRLDRPDALASLVLPVVQGDLHGEAWWERLLDHAHHVASVLALDGADHLLAYLSDDQAIAAWLRRLGLLLEALGIQLTLNLNSPHPPPNLQIAPQGPLFGNLGGSGILRPRDAAAEVIRQVAAGFRGSDFVLIHWAWGENDGDDHLPSLPWKQSALIFERPRQPLVLGPGLDRRHGAVLNTVAVHLPRLLELVGGNQSADQFRSKLPSLARMAIRAGVQKRLYLRRHVPESAAIQRGFLLERARLIVYPVGLDLVVRQLLGQNIADSKFSRELAQNILSVLAIALKDAGTAVNLDVGLDGLHHLDLAGKSGNLDVLPTLQEQVSAADALAQASGLGGFSLTRPANLSDADWRSFLVFARRKTQLSRLTAC
jgi:hypothetical protein